jgi:thiosulfate/3-mercaptopyruvate sulfurtransferase
MAPREKYRAGERVEMLCEHVRGGRRQNGWLPGQVVTADYRMVAVRFDTDVFTSNGWRAPDRTLWCTHGSRHLRRPAAGAAPPDTTGGTTPMSANPASTASSGYARPDVLVDTDWVAQHLDDPAVRLVESDEDILLYDQGHIPGAVMIDWVGDLNDRVRRDYLGREGFERLCAEKGIGNDTIVVFYGDKNNWWATYAFWVFQLFGHTNARILNGGRKKWIDEGRPLSKETPHYPRATYHAPERADYKIRAFRDQVLAHVYAQAPLVDVRSPGEYSGELLHMEAYPQEGALRGGHIPGARNIPWGKAAREDGTFKPADELRQLYQQDNGLRPEQNVIAYCRIGERSSHTWFVLTYLLGYPNVRNYDGSWTEWGNLVGVPIERNA